MEKLQTFYKLEARYVPRKRRHVKRCEMSNVDAEEKRKTRLRMKRTNF